LRDKLHRIHALGAELCVVGNGQPMHAQDFREREHLTFPLLVDPDLEAYAAAGLRRGVGSTFSPRVLVNAVRALSGGHLQGKTQGDPWQQGGAFVIAPPDRVLFEHISRAAGDHPRLEPILAALELGG